MSTATSTTRPAGLVLLHGDTWPGVLPSPWFYLAIGGRAPVGFPDEWTIRAQALERPGAAPLFDWTVAGGGVALGHGEVDVPSRSTRVDLPALQLRLRPGDWAGVPERWRGTLEVELLRGDAAAPDERYTVVSRRLVIVPDLVP